jgi:hypothetical protein
MRTASTRVDRAHDPDRHQRPQFLRRRGHRRVVSRRNLAGRGDDGGDRAHAVPQQVGDFAVLVHSGFARSRALLYNVAVGLATLVGALAGYFALAEMQQALPMALAVAASSLLYVAVADLIPACTAVPSRWRPRSSCC